MSKIVLTSCGIIDIGLQEEFKKLFHKDMEEVKVLFIPVAAEVEEGDKDWIQEEIDSIFALGIKKENMTQYRLDYELNTTLFDCIYVLGGNTFYLLKRLRESGFDQKIKEAIKKDIVYVGSSAGSVILGTTIEIALPVDDNTPNYVTDYTGLKCVDGIVIPHYGEEISKDYVEKQKEKYRETIYTIKNDHGTLMIDGIVKEK